MGLELSKCLSKQGETALSGKENSSASSKTDTVTLGFKGQNMRSLPTLAMNTSFSYISGYEKVSQLKTKSLACTYSTLKSVQHS